MCGVATTNGIGPRESPVSRCWPFRLLPGFQIAPVACPLARSPVLQYVHSIRLCLDVNRVAREIFRVSRFRPDVRAVMLPFVVLVIDLLGRTVAMLTKLCR